VFNERRQRRAAAVEENVTVLTGFDSFMNGMSQAIRLAVSYGS